MHIHFCADELQAIAAMFDSVVLTCRYCVYRVTWWRRG